MKNNLNQLVEKVLLKQLTPIVEQYLIELEQKNIFVPSMAASITPAGQTLRPNSNANVVNAKAMKQLFKVIKTTPLMVTMINAGLIDPAELGIPQQDEEENENSEGESEDTEETE